MEPRLKQNVLAWVTNGGCSGMKFFRIFYFNMEPCLKRNINVLAAKTILFHFRCVSMLK